MYKLIGLFVLVAVVVGNDLTVGLKDEGTKIYDQKLEASPAIWRQIKNVTVNATDGDLISRVIITDLRPEKDGEAIVVEGGEGQKNVTIELKSPTVFRGFEFNVEVYAVPDGSEHRVSSQQPKSDETPKVPETESKVPTLVSGDNFDDNLRKTRKTDEQDKDNVTPKLFESSSEAITTFTTPVNDHSTPAPSIPTLHVNKHSTPVPSIPTLHVNKENEGEKFNIPINIEKDIKTDILTTPKSFEPVEKKGNSDVDAFAVNQEPTHLNNTVSSIADNTKVTDKSEKPATHLPEVSKGLPKNPQFRNVRHTEDATTKDDDVTTEDDVTTNPSTIGYESTTELKESSSVDSSDAPLIPYFNWDVKVPTGYEIKPIGNDDPKSPKTVGSVNVSVHRNPAVMAPIPYNHYL